MPSSTQAPAAASSPSCFASASALSHADFARAGRPSSRHAAIIRCSAQAGTWAEACRAAIDICHARGVIDTEAIASLSNAAGARDEFGELVLAKLFKDGVEAAHAHMDEIRDTLFVGGAL